MSTEKTDTGASQDVGQVTGYFVQLPAASRNADVGFSDIWRRFKPLRLMILAIVVTTTILAVVVTLFMTPVYRSEVLLASTISDNSRGNWPAFAAQFGALASAAANNLSGGSSKDHAVAILRSRSFAEEFISSENLLPLLFSGRWDSDGNRWNVSEEEDIPSVSDGYKLFNGRIRSVTESRKTGLVTVSFEWTDRELAAQWANRFVERLNQYLRSKDIAEAERSIEFLNRELEKSSVVELRQGIFRLVEQQVETVMLANVREEYAFKVLDPAVVADENANVRPRTALIVFGAFMISLLTAVVIAMIRISIEEAGQG